MPRTYRPTTLRILSRHCPRALDFYEQDVPVDRRQFEAGVAAHAVLQACGELARRLERAPTAAEFEAEARSTCIALIETGRAFDGKPEPPLSPDRVFEGRDLALDWLSFNPLDPQALYEIGHALDGKGKPCAYGAPNERLRHVMDVLWLDEVADEETGARRVVIRDYKSNWPADERELSSVQRKAQAVLAMEFYGRDADMIRLEVVNLRTQRLFALDLWLNEAGRVKIQGWKRDLYALMDADERRAQLGRRPATPGAGCFGCPYLMACVDAQDFLERSRVPGTPELRATGYAVALAVRDHLADMLRADTEEAPIQIAGDAVVGTVGQEERRLTEEAYGALWDEWELGGGDGRGFARALKLGVANAEALAKILFPEKADRHERERWLNEQTRKQFKRLFGVHKVEVESPEQDATRKEAEDAATTV